MEKIIAKNTKEKKNEEKLNLYYFVNDIEQEKKKISDKDKYHMLMQLIESARKFEISKLGETDLIKYKWNMIKNNVNKLWNTIEDGDKYQIIIGKLTYMNIWRAGFKIDFTEDNDLLTKQSKEMISIKDIEKEKRIL